MLRTIQNFFAPKVERRPCAVASTSDLDLEDIPRYPPFMKGLPCSPSDKVLATQAELISRIRLVLGMGDEQYERIAAPVIKRYAEFVHLLPASEAHHHRGAGGLLRHGLEVGFWAAQFSLGQVFPYDGPPRNKRAHELRWLFAAFVAGLTHDLGKPLSDMEITTAQGESVWPPYIESLEGWANRVQAERYFVRWRSTRVHKRHEAFTLMMFQRIMGEQSMSFLSEYDSRLLPSLFNAIGGTTAADPLAKLVIRADQESVKRDLQQSRINVDEFSYGVPVEKYVFDAMRVLIKAGTWKVNQPGADVWLIDGGVFISWQNAIGVLRDELGKTGVPGIPRDSDTLADILIERGYAISKEAVTEDGEVLNYRYWPITAPIKADGVLGEARILALRLDAPELIFTGEIPQAASGARLLEMLTEKKPNDSHAGSSRSPAATGEPSEQTAMGAPHLAQAQQAVNQVQAAQGDGVAAQTSQQTHGAVGKAKGTIEEQQEEQQPDATQNSEIPPDFPDMVSALMATEPEAPPLQLAPQQITADIADEDTVGAVPAGKEEKESGSNVPALDTSEHETCILRDGEPNQAPAKSHKRQRSPQKKEKSRAVNADILANKNVVSPIGHHFDPFGNGSSQGTMPVRAIPAQLPGLPTGKAPPGEKAQKRSGTTSVNHAYREKSSRPKELQQAFGAFPSKVATPILSMLEAILSGNARLGETIDRRSDLYCVRASAFESDDAFLKWRSSAHESKMLAEAPSVDAQWEADAVVLCNSLQAPIDHAVRRLEQSIDPFARPEHGLPDCPGEESRSSRRPASRGKEKGAPQPNVMPSDNAQHSHDASTEDRSTLPLNEISAPLDEADEETIAQAIQKAMELSQPRPKITAKEALDRLVAMLEAKNGEWLADLRIDDEGTSVDLSRTFDRILAQTQCEFSKGALRMAIKSQRQLSLAQGRIWSKVKKG